jgi:hypothetical protein
MTKSLKWEAGLERFISNCKKVMERLGVENDVNFLRKVECLLTELEEARALKKEWIEITNTSDIGLAKKRTRTLMRMRFEEETTSIPELFLTAPYHWIKGKPQSAKFPQGLPPMLPSQAEKFLRREVWPYLRDLMSKLYFYTEIERVRILEDLEDQYYSETPRTFLDSLYKYTHYIDEREEEEEHEQSVPLTSLLNLCIGFYPDQLLEDCRERSEEAGFVSRSWVENIDTKFQTSNTADAREEVARIVLVRIIHRISGGEGIPLPEQESNIARRLSTKRWSPYGPEWIVTAETRLADLLEPLATFDR